MAALAGMIEPILAGMGLELVDTQVSNRGGLLRIFIDKPGGVTIDDCTMVSRHLGRVFEVEGIDYDRMEVSSPGLDRPLVKRSDFERFAGNRADVRMRVPDATGRRRFVGVLHGVQDGSIEIEAEGLRVLLALDGVERARLVPQL
ncbi:MAG: ribosome maturation factor RimP [Betaproteobacteria bacterium]|nr:ribosome maturation factor RimP [Betaproteobacteria bacterium]